MKKITIISILILLLGLQTACSNKVGSIIDGYTDFGNLNLPQFKYSEIGEEIAVISTNKGEIKIKLLEEAAPIAVEHFKKWVREGKYTDSYFGSIKKDENIMLQEKSYEPNMTEEEVDKYYAYILDNFSFDEDYELEINDEYLHFSGAVGFAHYTDLSLGINKPMGLFYIVANSGLDDVTLDIMENMPAEYGFTKDIITGYGELGGVLEYNGKYVIFGQVFYGMDLVYEINNMPVDYSGYPIEEPVVIEKIEIVKYDGK